MLRLVPGTRVAGDELRFAQYAHVVRRVLEIGRGVAAETGPTTQTAGAAQTAGPAQGAPADPEPVVGRYRHLVVRGERLRVFYEEAGSGRDVLFLHTAGADGRQFHHLMNDRRLLDRCRMVAFDLPWHGRSFPPAGAVPGGHALTTDGYAEVVIAIVDALRLERPIVVGSSMGGQICLELAYRSPDRLGGVVACEASDRVPGRQVAWARHPEVNQALFVPEWVDGLMAPQSPAEYRREVWWGYSQGGFGTFFGDILFYSGDWDGRDRVPYIDTARCPVVMLTGEYDYSCTPEMSQSTAERIPGATFRMMADLGHFPMAENPPAFAEYLIAAFDEIEREGR
ncbi:MAG: alpha/beta fold hydrolase [Streptosporangiales bacterium]|nr:alpha/beta fold hydrolase [Streptosporangiales bacterium]